MNKNAMDNATLDSSTAIRPGEELNTGQLRAYLAAQLPELAGPLTIEQFPRGFSNLTYLLRSGEHELVLRRPPFGANIKSAHDMGREYKVLAGLLRVYPKVPRPLLYCADEAVIGAPFYVMARVKGVILRAQAVPTLNLSPPLMQKLSTAMIDNLAAIHAVDYTAAGLADLGRPQGYVQRQIDGWTKRYRNAQTDELPNLEQVITWLATHLPPASGAALIHNDYKYDNFVLAPDDLTQIIAVLDWEMCTIGDPLLDLGTTLGYWIEPNDSHALASMFGLTTLPGNLNRQQLVERYSATSGRAVPDPLFYYVYGSFKIAVIIQQIYFRYQQGHTRDERFAHLLQVVRDYSNMAVLALEKGRIHHLTG